MLIFPTQWLFLYVDMDGIGGLFSIVPHHQSDGLYVQQRGYAAAPCRGDQAARPSEINCGSSSKINEDRRCPFLFMDLEHAGDKKGEHGTIGSNAQWVVG